MTRGIDILRVMLPRREFYTYLTLEDVMADLMAECLDENLDQEAFNKYITNLAIDRAITCEIRDCLSNKPEQGNYNA